MYMICIYSVYIYIYKCYNLYHGSTTWWFRICFYFQITSPRLVRQGPWFFAGPKTGMRYYLYIVITGIFHKIS